MNTSVAKALCELNVLLNLENLATRRMRRGPRASRTEFLLLARLAHTSAGALSQVDLADLTQLSVSQVQKLTESLERRELVRRVLEAPRGGVLIRITEKGKKKFTQDKDTGAKEFAVFDIVLDSDAERKSAMELIQKATEYIRQQVETTP